MVIDASALAAALVGLPEVLGIRDRLGSEDDLAAPHPIDLEVIQALRRLSRAGRLSERAAIRVRRDLVDLPIVRYPHDVLLERIWGL